MKLRTKTGITANYELLGEGPPLVLIHGIGGNLHFWDGHFEAFSRNRRVLRYDICGFGETEGSADGEYTIPLLAEDLYALLGALQVARPVLAGYDLGARIALEVAMRRPAFPEGLVLVSPGLPPQDLRAQLLERLSAGDATGAATGVTETEFSPGFAEQHPEIVARYRALLASTNPAQFRSALAALPAVREPWGPHLVQCPTLIIAGEHDDAGAAAAMRSLQQQVPGAELALIPSGRAVPLETRDEFAGEVQKFLARAATAADRVAGRA